MNLVSHVLPALVPLLKSHIIRLTFSENSNEFSHLIALLQKHGAGRMIKQNVGDSVAVFWSADDNNLYMLNNTDLFYLAVSAVQSHDVGLFDSHLVTAELSKDQFFRASLNEKGKVTLNEFFQISEKILLDEFTSLCKEQGYLDKLPRHPDLEKLIDEATDNVLGGLETHSFPKMCEEHSCCNDPSHRHEVHKLSREGADNVLSGLENPPSPNEALLKAAEQYSECEEELSVLSEEFEYSDFAQACYVLALNAKTVSMQVNVDGSIKIDYTMN